MRGLTNLIAVFVLSSVLGCADAPSSCDDQTGIALSILPAEIVAGGQATLVATFIAGSGNVTPDVGAVVSGAAQILHPTVTTSYRLTVSVGTCVSERTAGLTVVPAQDIDVSISPAMASIDQDAELAFQATVTGAPGSSVLWSVNESNGGTVDANGNYTAPSHAGTFHVIAASALLPSKTASATVTVNDVVVSVAPDSAQVVQGGSQTFSAAVLGSADTAVVWSVEEAGGGTISSAGAYVAPSKAGTFHVLATSHSEPSISASASVVVPEVTVAIAPLTAPLLQQQAQTFVATVTGSVDSAVSWTVTEAGGGAITAAGIYTAPVNAGTFQVVATSHAQPSISASAAVTVSDVSVDISPTAADLVIGGQQIFDASASGIVDPSVTWSVSESGGGAVSSSGVYTAPLIVGTYHVVATSAGNPARSATAAVSVLAVTVSVLPPTPSVHAGASQLFTGTVLGTSDTAIDWSVLEANGGSIDANGNYTAPIQSGVYHVVGASHAAPSATGSSTVTVTGGLPNAPTLTNVVAQVHGDTVRVSFDPVDNAADYRIYLAPAVTDIDPLGDGGTAIHDGLYRCAGAREAIGVPTDNDPLPPSVYLDTYVAHAVAGVTRSAADEILGYVYISMGPGLSPVWAMGDPSPNGDNPCYAQRWTESRAKKYATSPTEHAALLASAWRDDGVAFYVPAAGAGTVPVYTALTTDTAPARLYFSTAAEKSARASLTPAVAFNVLSASAPGTKPLYRVFYNNGCGRSHDELVAGQARFQRAAHQGLTPIAQVNWSGLTAPTTVVVEALDEGCPFQGHLSPQSIDAGVAPGGSPHQAFVTIDQVRAADPMGEVFVNGQYTATNRPNAIARSILLVSPAALEAMDFADDFPLDGGTVLPMIQTGTQGFESHRFDSPAYDIEFYTMDLPYVAIGPMLGELWVTYGDWASDTNGKFRLTVKQKATLSTSTFLHATGEVDLVSTNRRYPQILISTVDAPVQDNLPSGATLLMQAFSDWPERIDLELCDHRTWDVNNQCPRFYIDKESQNPFGTDPLPPHVEVGDLSGVDRRVRLDLYLSTARAYALVDGAPWACANLPAPTDGGVPAGPVTVTFGDVLYHSGVDVVDPPYTFHRAHMYVETRRHFDAIGFKSGVPAPAWNEAVLPCSSTLVP